MKVLFRQFPRVRRGLRLDAMICAVLLSAACFGMPNPVAAAVHALLVGVNSYPALGPEFALRGPGNDIAAARDFLLSRGIEPGRITVLADGLAGASGDPTLAAIEAAFEALRRQVGPGDTVYLHFAGHGSQQLGADLDDEADALDEVFLPMDTQPMDETRGVFPNALSDGLLRRHVTRLRNTGAFVWLVFDSCHSGGMTRGAGGGSERRIRLALDPRELRSLRRRLAASDGIGLPPPPSIPDLAPDAGGFAAFFAAQDHQATLERRMLAEDDRFFGVFSFNLFAVLNRSAALSYRQAANALVAAYAAQGEASAVPKFEGTGLDKAVLGQAEVDMRLSWPIVTEGASGSGTAPQAHFLAAGRLQGLGPGDRITVSRVSRGGTVELGQAAITSATAFRSRLDPLEDAVVRALSQAPDDAVLWGEISERRFRTETAVALPQPGSPIRLTRAAEKLQTGTAENQAPRIRWVTSDAPAALRLLPRGANAVLSAADAVLDGEGASPVEIPLTGEVDRDADALHSAILGAAQALRVMTVALEAASLPFDQAISLRLQVARVAPESLDRAANRADLNCGRVSRMEREEFVNGVTVLRHCDLLSLQIINRSEKDWDVTILFVGARNDLAVLFPPVGQSNRIHAGDRLSPLQFAAYVDGASGPRDVSERLIVLAQEAKPGYPEADFRFLAEGVGAAPARGSRLAGYGALIASAGNEAASRGGLVDGGTEGAPKGTATVLRWILRRED